MKPDGERIASLEQHMQDQDKKLDQIVLEIKEVKMIVTNQMGFEARITKLEGSSNLWKWLSPTLAAVVGSVLTFLIISYLTNLK